MKTLPAQENCEALQKMVAEATKQIMAEHDMAEHDQDQLRFDLVEAKNFDARMNRLLRHHIEQSGAAR